MSPTLRWVGLCFCYNYYLAGWGEHKGHCGWLPKTHKICGKLQSLLSPHLLSQPCHCQVGQALPLLWIQMTSMILYCCDLWKKRLITVTLVNFLSMLWCIPSCPWRLGNTQFCSSGPWPSHLLLCAVLQSHRQNCDAQEKLWWARGQINEKQGKVSTE